MPEDRPLLACTDSVEATREMAAALASLLRSRDVLLLSGDLGAGKTAFVQGLGAALGVAERITSPTFTLVHEYEARLRLHHLDVYRLDSLDEVVDLGLPELLEDGVTVVEWGEQILPALGVGHLRLRFTFGDVDGPPDRRWIEVSANGASWGWRREQVVDTLRPWLRAAA